VQSVFQRKGEDVSWGDDTTEFVVVVNDEGQYSIWPSYKTIPSGWKPDGKRGQKADCLAHIDEVWTDMRPISLRRALAQDAAPVKTAQ
jgi:MbtH protein